MNTAARKNAPDRLQAAFERFGSARLAAILGLPYDTVRSWKRRGIPRRRRQQVIAAITAEAQGLLDDVRG